MPVAGAVALQVDPMVVRLVVGVQVPFVIIVVEVGREVAVGIVEVGLP